MICLVGLAGNDTLHGGDGNDDAPSEAPASICFTARLATIRWTAATMA